MRPVAVARFGSVSGGLLLLIGALLCASPPSRAAESVLAFENPADAARYTELLEDYRCLKCQNQNLADSNASLAKDLRDEIYRRVIAGDSKAAIDAYLVSRYGDFVLYRPPFKATTALLWVGPFVLLAGALWAAVLIGRRSGDARGATAPSDEALSEARRLLGERRERRGRR